MPGSEWVKFFVEMGQSSNFRNRPTSGGRLYASEARTNGPFSAPKLTLFTSWSVYPLRYTRALTARGLVHRTSAPPKARIAFPFRPDCLVVKVPAMLVNGFGLCLRPSRSGLRTTPSSQNKSPRVGCRKEQVGGGVFRTSSRRPSREIPRNGA
jgi:hypothetical protein